MLKLSGWPRLSWGSGPRIPSQQNAERAASSFKGQGQPSYGMEVRVSTRSRPPLAAPSPIQRLYNSAHRASVARGANFHIELTPHHEQVAWRGSRALMGFLRPGRRALGRIPRAQLAFKDSMVHGILQFTPRIAFRYVLHRCESRDIRCRESYCFRSRYREPQQRKHRSHVPRQICVPWRHPAPCSGIRPEGRVRQRPEGLLLPPATSHYSFAGRVSQRETTTMILPQVHLRKPCYDFSFL